MILLVYTLASTRRVYPYHQLLRHLGIPFAVAYLASGNVNAELQTPAGNFAPASSDLRNYFKNFRAVFVLEEANLTTAGLLASGNWLTWNNADDTPVFYFGLNMNANYTAFNSLIPTEFPIVRPNPTDVSSGITAQTQPTTATVLEPFSEVYDMYTPRTGTAVYFHREQATAIAPVWCSRGATPHLLAWRLDTTKHAALGSNGEILLTPAPQPDVSYPSDTVLAYRYRNRYFMPQMAFAPELNYHQSVLAMNTWAATIIWFLYALKLAGITPQRVLPLHYETDHPLQFIDGLTDDAYTFRHLRDGLDWMRSFCRQTGLVVHHGVTVGGMTRRRTDTHNTRSGLTNWHWCILNGTQYGLSSQAVAFAQQAHDILIAGHREGTTPCGPHDHTIAMLNHPTDGRGLWGDPSYQALRRHQASDYAHLGLSFPLEAPNIVRIRRGNTCCAKHVMPAGALKPDAVLQRVGDAEYYEQDFDANAYSDNTINLGDVPAGSLNIARVVIESHIAEMRALGFPDGHGGEHGYTNTAANSSGGDYYWQACKEYGFKAIRSNYHCNIGGTAKNKATPPNMIWNGFHLLHFVWMDAGLDIWDAITSYSINVNNDLTTGFPATAHRIHRRAVAVCTLRWLACCTVLLGAPYIHPISGMVGGDQNDPVRRFDGGGNNYWNRPAWNAVVELFENMRVIVGVLSDYLKFGSVSDLIMVRERVMN